MLRSILFASPVGAPKSAQLHLCDLSAFVGLSWRVCEIERRTVSGRVTKVSCAGCDLELESDSCCAGRILASERHDCRRGRETNRFCARLSFKHTEGRCPVSVALCLWRWNASSHWQAPRQVQVEAAGHIFEGAQPKPRLKAGRRRRRRRHRPASSWPTRRRALASIRSCGRASARTGLGERQQSGSDAADQAFSAARETSFTPREPLGRLTDSGEGPRSCASNGPDERKQLVCIPTLDLASGSHKLQRAERSERDCAQNSAAAADFQPTAMIIITFMNGRHMIRRRRPKLAPPNGELFWPPLVLFGGRCEIWRSHSSANSNAGQQSDGSGGNPSA